MKGATDHHEHCWHVVAVWSDLGRQEVKCCHCGVQKQREIKPLGNPEGHGPYHPDNRPGWL